MTSRAYQKRDFLFDRLLELHPDLYKPESISARKQRERPCISVILLLDGPIHDVEKTLESLARQTTDDFDVVLVTRNADGRKNNIWLASLKYEVLCDPSAHATEMFHRAALGARGEFLIFLRPGDTLVDHGLEQLVLAVCSYPHAVFAAGYLTECPASGRGRQWLNSFAFMQNCIPSRALIAKRAYMMLAKLDPQNNPLLMDLTDQHICSRLHSAGFRGPTVSGILTNVGSCLVVGVGEPNVPRCIGVSALPHQLQFETPPALDPLLAQLAVCWRHSLDPPLNYDRSRRSNTPNPFPCRYWRGDARPSLLYFASHDMSSLEGDITLLTHLKRAGARLTIIGTREFKKDQRKRLETLTEDMFILGHVVRNNRAATRVATQIIISRAIDVICMRRGAVADRVRKQFAMKSVAFVCLAREHPRPEEILATAATIDRAAKLRDFQKMILQQPIF
jgi:hypothetical protein